jgi:hypothetical protein
VTSVDIFGHVVPDRILGTTKPIRKRKDDNAAHRIDAMGETQHDT